MANVSINRIDDHNSVAKTSDRSATGWIVSPAFDLLFFANVLWLLAFLPAYLSPEGEPYVEFWQVYFIATPHRWITHFLVVMDPDRRSGRNWLFAVIAVGLALVICGVQIGTGSLAGVGIGPTTSGTGGISGLSIQEYCASIRSSLGPGDDGWTPTVFACSWSTLPSGSFRDSIVACSFSNWTWDGSTAGCWPFPLECCATNCSASLEIDCPS